MKNLLFSNDSNLQNSILGRMVLKRCDIGEVEEALKFVDNQRLDIFNRDLALVLVEDNFMAEETHATAVSCLLEGDDAEYMHSRHNVKDITDSFAGFMHIIDNVAFLDLDDYNAGCWDLLPPSEIKAAMQEQASWLGETYGIGFLAMVTMGYSGYNIESVTRI